MTLRVTTPDVTRYHSSEIVDRFVPAEFLCAWIRYKFSKKLYIFCASTTMTTAAPFDSSKAWMERVSINLLCTIAANILWLTRSLEGLNSLEGQAVIVSFIFLCTIIAESISFFGNISLLTIQILLKLNFEKLVIIILGIFHLIFWISWLYLNIGLLVAENVSDKS